MENKNVGWLIIGISLVVVFIIILFNHALSSIIDSTCTMAGHTSCTMTQTLNEQTYLSYGIVGILALIGLFLIFSKPNERLVIRRIKNSKGREIKIDSSSLNSEEKQVISLVQKHKAIFQAELIEKLGFSKAKVSRILDKLENRGFIERKRRGMTNIVVLKN